MFAVRYFRCILKTFECVNQCAKYSQLKRSFPNGGIFFKLPKSVFTNRQTFCSSASSEDSFEYKPDIEAIAKGDPDIEKKLKVLLLEIEVLRQEGHLVPSPSFMKQEDWEELVKLKSRSGRNKFLTFLFKKEKTKENQKIKRQQRQLEVQQLKLEKEEPPPEGMITYGFHGSNIFLRFYDTTVNQFYNSRLINAMIFGQKLVIDCGFDRHMSRQENINCAKQLMLLFGDNRIHDDPYDLHLCNFQDGVLSNYLKRQIPTLDDPTFPLNVHEESYLDLFPKDKLVYLTPHCNETMENYDHDAIYIIGAIVDKSNQEPLSSAKAKKENIRMVKFPLEKYLQWNAGSGKTLTLNQCIMIMLDIKKTGDWKYALRHVPKRKIVDLNTAFEADGNTNPNLRYDRRIKKFKTIWKPSSSLSKSSYKNQQQSGGLLDDDDDESDTKPKVSLKHIFK